MIDDFFDEVISIHALRGEGDNFRPVFGTVIYAISIHALRGEGDPVRISGNA